MSQFISLPPEVNNEFVKSLDDEALYAFCRTSRDADYLCSLPAVWDAGRPSVLASLNFLRDEYTDWIDFYENVRKDYIYVVEIISTSRNLAGDNRVNIKISYDIQSAFNIVFGALHIDDNNRRMMIARYTDYIGTNLFIYLKPETVQITIGLAHKNIYSYKAGQAYGYTLYQITRQNIVRSIPNIEFLPVLDSTLEVAFLSEGMLLSKFNDNIYYGDVTTKYLTYGITNKYKSLHLSDNNVLFSNLTTGAYVGRIASYSEMSGLLVLVPGVDIDGSDEYNVVVLPYEVNNINSTKYINYAQTSEDMATFLKEHGTFYELNKLRQVVNALKNNELRL